MTKLLVAWGHDGFMAHTEGVAAFYKAKRDVFAAAMDTHLAGLAEWAVPEAGMFFWCVPPSLPSPRRCADSELS